VLSPEILKSIAARLENKDDGVLTGQPVLPLESLGPYSHSLYRALLYASFHEPIIWSHINALSYISVDDTEVSLDCLHSRAREAIRETQGALGVPRTLRPAC
jgi:hypothetical protein